MDYPRQKFHKFVDRYIIWYLQHRGKSFPCAPIVVDDYVKPLSELSPSFSTSIVDLGFSLDALRGRGFLHFPSPSPIGWGSGKVNEASLEFWDGDREDALIWVHGFLMDAPSIEPFARGAINCVSKRVKAEITKIFFHLPLHYERKLIFEGRRVGAEWAFQNAPLRLMEVVSMGVNEIYQFVQWWLQTHSGKVVIIGISLGGGVVGWLPTLFKNPRVHFILLVPALDMYHIFQRSPLVSPLKDALIGTQRGMVSNFLRRWSPYRYSLSVSSEQVKIIGGAYDFLLPLQGIVWDNTPSSWNLRTVGKWNKVWLRTIPYGHGSWSLPIIGREACTILSKTLDEIYLVS